MLEVPLSFTQAVLGDGVEVPTLHGKATLTIPAYTQNGTVFKMRGKGLKSHNGGSGDQLVKIYVKVPDKLNKKQYELVQEMSNLEEEKPSGVFKRFFGWASINL